ncbi:MAG: ATP-binding cassette domain-containing protein [Pirellulaceae bacterium]
MKQERYRSIESFSTGMRQKVKFAAAIVHDPDFLILDEPTSGLDPEEREQLLYRVRSLCVDFGKSVLISTHILPDVQQICDHVMILARGKIRLNESFETINRPATPSLTVRVLGNRDQFVEKARESKLNVEVDIHGAVIVRQESEQTISMIWNIASQTGAAIQTLEPAKNSLEEVFMAVVRESAHANP